MTNSIIVCILVGICAVALTILLLLSVRLQRRRIFKLAHYGAVVLICVGSVLAILAQLGVPFSNPLSSPSSTLAPSTSILVTEGDISPNDNFKNNLISLQASTGILRWRIPLSSSLATLYDKVVNNSLYEIGPYMDNDTIVSLNAQTGKQQWQFNATPENLGTNPAFSTIDVNSISVTNEYVYAIVNPNAAGTGTGEIALCSLHANNGTLVACHNLFIYTSVETRPEPLDLFTCGNTVLVYTESSSSSQGSIQAFSGKDLSPLWQQTLNTNTVLNGIDEYIYLSDKEEGKTYTLRPQDGKKVWSIDAEVGPDNTAPTGSYMYDYTGKSLAAYDQHTGRKVWQQEIDQDSAATPAVNIGQDGDRQFTDEQGRTVYVLTDDLHLFGYDAMTGNKTVATTLQIPGSPGSSCSVAVGKIVAIGNTLIIPIKYGPIPAAFVWCPEKSFIAAFSASTGTSDWIYDDTDLSFDNLNMWVV